MSHEMQFNSRMPYMKFNWFTHEARAGKLTMAERGLFDAVRCELWKVVGCKVPRSSVETILRIKANSTNAKALDTLIARGLLQVDRDGLIYDEVQVVEFSRAAKKSEVNTLNGATGGRPRNVLSTASPRVQTVVSAEEF